MESHNNNSQSLTDFSSAIFNNANLIFILLFLAIYIIAYLLIGIVFKKTTETSSTMYISRSIDFIVLLFLFFYLVIYYIYNTETRREQIFKNWMTGSYIFFNNPMSIVSVLFFLIIFYVCIYLFRIPMTPDAKPATVSLIEFTAWILFIILAFVDFFKYVVGIFVADIFYDLFNSLPTDNLIINGNIYGNAIVNGAASIPSNISGNVFTMPLQTPVQKDEVFNVSNNLYTYDDAQAVCSAYGAQLATYDQIEEAYKNGAEWCNYGWSDGQMAFFPTQKGTWEKLQKTTDHKNDCGRPGINGGYFANPYIKFGVNCYGKKPSPTDSDLARMSANAQINIPKTAKDAALESKINYWKQNKDKMLVLNSFDRTKWSEY